MSVFFHDTLHTLDYTLHSNIVSCDLVYRIFEFQDTMDSSEWIPLRLILTRTCQQLHHDLLILIETYSSLSLSLSFSFFCV